MIKTILLGLFALFIAVSPSIAQSWGVYNPNAKFAEVFGRPAALETNGAINADPSLGEVARGNNAFLRTALDGMLVSSARVSACQDLSSLKLPWVSIRSVELVAADKNIPAYCKFIGVLDKEITFEVDMPEAAKWNGKFLMGGG